MDLSIPDLLFEEGSFGVFLLVTVALGGGGAWLTGRAIAGTWLPAWQVGVYMLLMGATVRFFHMALFGGQNGLEIVDRLFRQAADHLEPGGQLIVEFGFGQAEQVARLGEAAGWRIVRIREDLQSIPRTIVLAATGSQG